MQLIAWNRFLCLKLHRFLVSILSAHIRRVVTFVIECWCFPRGLVEDSGCNGALPGKWFVRLRRISSPSSSLSWANDWFLRPSNMRHSVTHRRVQSCVIESASLNNAKALWGLTEVLASASLFVASQWVDLWTGVGYPLISSGQLHRGQSICQHSGWKNTYLEWR